MEFLLLLLFFGLMTGLVAKVRGNPFFLWALVGFCLPTIGVIIALLYPSGRREPKRRCEECGNVVALHDQVCMRCGRDLTFPAPAEAAGSPETRW